MRKNNLNSTVIKEDGIDDVNVEEKIKAAEKAMVTLLSTGFFGHRLGEILFYL